MATINTPSRRNTALGRPPSGVRLRSARAPSPADTRWRLICPASRRGRRPPRHRPRHPLSLHSPSAPSASTARLPSAPWLEDQRAAPSLEPFKVSHIRATRPFYVGLWATRVKKEYSGPLHCLPRDSLLKSRVSYLTSKRKKVSNHHQIGFNYHHFYPLTRTHKPI